MLNLDCIVSIISYLEDFCGFKFGCRLVVLYDIEMIFSLSESFLIIFNMLLMLECVIFGVSNIFD